MLAIFLSWNSKKLNQSSGKEKESRCLAFKSSTKHEIRHFHVVVVQWLQRNVQKSVIHVQSCCFTNRNPLLFCRSRLRRRRPCFSPQERFYFNGHTERSCTQTQTELEPLYNSSIIHPGVNSKGLRIAVTWWYSEKENRTNHTAELWMFLFCLPKIVQIKWNLIT